MAREVHAVRNHVGMIEIANFAKHEFKGVAARDYLNTLLAGFVPQIGRISLTPVLTPKGKLYGDLTVACLNEQHFILFGSGAMQDAHRRYFEQDLPAGVEYRNVSSDWHGVALSGPQSRQLLQQVVREDVSNQALKFRDIRQTYVCGVPALLSRISFSGELGYEIYCQPQYQLQLCTTLERCGQALGLKWYGARALMSLRLEKHWGVWTLDYRPDFTAQQSGMDAFINWNKEFVGKEAALAEREADATQKLVTLILDTNDIDVSGDEAVLVNDQAVGYITSGGYGHHVQKSLAMAYIQADLAVQNTPVQVEILGEFFNAVVQTQALYDPDGLLMRS